MVGLSAPTSSRPCNSSVEYLFGKEEVACSTHVMGFMTSIPSKIGLTLLAVYWTAMATLTTYALMTNGPHSNFTSDQRAGRLVPPL